MKTSFVHRDDRTTMVERASYRWAYLFLAFGILLSVAYRSFFLDQSSWDLLALVLLSGVITTFYQSLHHILSWRWTALTALTAAIAAVIGAIVALVG